MKLYKKVCTCGYSWLSDDKKDFECPYTGADDKAHIVTNSTNITALEYAEMWSADLENANRHSLTSLPFEILDTVKTVVKSQPQTLKIMKTLYEKEIGV